VRQKTAFTGVTATLIIRRTIKNIQVNKMFRSFTGWALLGCAVPVNSVFACATCLCGDPTITSMGTEKPFAGRMRVGVEYLSRGETVGIPALSEHVIDEQRLNLSVSYAFSMQWIVAASLPLVSKQINRYDLTHEQASGVGDLDLSARWFLGGDDHFPARELWGLQFGLRLPTSSEQQVNGVPIDFDAQPGTGASVPSLGAWYGYYRTPWFFYSSVVYQHAIDEGYQSYQAGDVWLVTGHAQYAWQPKLALSFSLDARYKQQDRYAGIVDADSGGLLLMASPGLAWMPLTDLVINLSYQVPVLEHVHGRQQEAASLRVGVVYDF
jgi:hypothetical protein